MKTVSIIPCEPGWVVAIWSPVSESLKEKFGRDHAIFIQPIIAWRIEDETNEQDYFTNMTTSPIAPDPFMTQRIISNKVIYEIFAPSKYKETNDLWTNFSIVDEINRAEKIFLRKASIRAAAEASLLEEP